MPSPCGIHLSSHAFPSLFPFLGSHHLFSKTARKFPSKTLNPILSPSQNPFFSHSSSPLPPNPTFSRATHVPFSSSFNSSKETELELLGKPSPVSIPSSGDEEEKEEAPTSSNSVDLDGALAPFLKFFNARDLEGIDQFGAKNQAEVGRGISKVEEGKRIVVEYYEPKSGDLVVGVVVSGNENKLDVNVGADMLATMLTKEVLPFYDAELDYLCCDLEKDSGEFMVSGKMGVVKDEDAMGGGKLPGRPVVEVGMVIFAEVLGRTLSGRPLLSSRRMFRRVAWHRVRQIKHINEPIEVKIFEWNTGGLLTRIEGLRAFIPKAELMNKVSSFADLKGNVGRQMFVTIRRIDEATNDLIISEREAWDMLHLREGTLLEGTIRKIFPFGAQVKIGNTNRSGLLHISNISRSRVTAVSDVLQVDEKVKVLVVKSMFPDNISLSIADLESEPGLFLSDKEKVFSEAEEMAKKFRKRMPVVGQAQKADQPPNEVLPFDDEAKQYANWKWLYFEADEESKASNNSAT